MHKSKRAWREDLSGKIFAKLTVIKLSHRNSRGHAIWLVKCECGTQKAVAGHMLKGQKQISCGCVRARNLITQNIKHGLSKSQIYYRWCGMIKRCRNPHCKQYPNYGGRGIAVCGRWLVFENFLEDMGHPPKGMSLDRKDNNLGYSKENCRWATRKEQSRNTSRNRIMLVADQKLVAKDAAKKVGLSYSKVLGRLHRGWDQQDALNLPHYARKPKLMQPDLL